MNPSQIQEIQKYPHIKAQCTSTLDLHISDLRSILLLPLQFNPVRMGYAITEIRQPLMEMTGGCNFISCTIILDIISGLSVCMYFKNGKIGFETERDRGARFRELLENYFPWNYETLQKTQVSSVLWTYLRNPLVHNLGILPFGGVIVNEVNIDKIQINKSPIEFQEVLKLESLPRTMNLGSTFDLDHSTFNVNIPCLYWGLHQLLRNLFSDATQMIQVEAWYRDRI